MRSCGSGTGSQGSGTEALLATKCKRQKQSAQKRNLEKGDDEDNFLHARVPKNILKKLALLSVKLKMSVRQALIYTMAFYKLCGIDPGDVDLSLTSCFRYRRDEASAVAQDRLESVAAIVIQNSSKIFVHYDTKQIEEDIGGEKKLVERLAVVVSSPVLRFCT